jgi:uncharacterized RDD family membrane protein YckC
MDDLLSDVWEAPKIAKKRTRFGAVVIDALILFLVEWIIAFFSGQTNHDGSFGFHLQGLPAFLALGILFCLIPVQEGLTGKTIGKRVAGIKVVREDFSECTAGNAIIRHLCDIVDLPLVGLIVASTNAKNQRIGDLAARTIVIDG